MTDAADPAAAMLRHAALLRHWCREPPWPDDGPPTLVQTHLSSLLLGRQWVLKLKKPLALDFVDFRDPARRRQACEDELRLNRRTAAPWYVDVLPVSGSAEAPRLGAGGEAGAPWDWALRMRRFDETSTYDRLAAAGTLGAAQVDALAARVAAFHQALPPSPAAWGDPQAVLGYALDNLRTLDATLPAQAPALAALRGWSHARHAAIAAALARRRAQGRVREGHGDLHLGNVAWIDGDAVPFDALEFDARLRHIDILGDAVFAYADLLDHGLPALAWRYLGGWVEACGDHDGLPLLRWFAAYRALVRAKVAAVRARQPDADAATAAAATTAAQRRVALALAIAQPPRPRLVLTCGLSGSGKSSVAQQLAERLGGLRVRSDVERKRLHGLAPTARPADPATLYHAGATRRTYARLLAIARWAVEGDLSLVVDAAYLRRDEREALRALARGLGVEATIVECRAPAAVLRERLARRAAAGHDPSDATAEVLALQQRVHEPPAPDEGAIALDTDASPAVVATRVDALARRLSGGAAG